MRKIFNKKFLLVVGILIAMSGLASAFTGADLAIAENGGGEENSSQDVTDDQDKDDQAGLQVKDKLIILFGWIIYFIVWVLGKLLIFIIGWLTQVAAWDNFVGVAAVTEGWSILRDLCNMFFILILLIIAFATILGRESYNLKQLLPKVIIMAILINFSKAICGAVIEFSQVIMLSFVNAFAGSSAGNSGANNLVHLLGMKEMMSFISKKSESGVSLGLETVGGIVVGFVAALIAFVTICSMLGVLLFRIIMLWVYIVLSPLAFLLYAFPHGKSYASRWLSSFSKQVIVGPVMAFFIWLALYTAQETSSELGSGVVESQEIQEGVISGFLAADVFQTYIITIAFLVGGLIITQEIGGVSGQAAGKGLQMLNKGKQLTGQWAGRKAKDTAKVGAKATGRGALGVAEAGTAGAAGLAGGKSDSLNKLRKFTGAWRQNLKKNREEEKTNKRRQTLKKMGMGEESFQSLGELSDTNLGRYSKAAAGLGATGLATAATGGIGGAIVGTTSVAHGVASKFNKKAEENQQDRKSRKEKAEQEKNEEIEDAKKERDNNESVQKRDEALADLDKKRKRGDLSEEDYRKNRKKINEKFEPQVQEAEQKYQEKVSSAKKEHEEKVKNIDQEKKSISEKVAKGKWSPIKNWHPQKVTKEAAKKETEEFDNAKKRRNALASGEKPQNFEGKSWYSPSGQTSQQTKNFDQLISEEQKSQEALRSMTDHLDELKQRISEQGINAASKTELNNISELKKGMAAYQQAGNDQKGKLNPVIDIVNEIPTGEDNTKETVEELKNKVITKG